MDISKIIEAYTPAEEPFAVSLPGGETLTFRAIGGLSDWERLKARAVEFATSLPADGDTGHPMGWAAGATAEDAFVAYVIADRSVEPAITPADALRLVLRCGMLADELIANIKLASRDFDAMQMAGMIDKAKKKGDPIQANASS